MNERDLFLAAIEIPHLAARQAFLQSKCGDDTNLLSRVEALVASHHGESQFLESPAVEQMVEKRSDETAATIMSEEAPTQDDQFQTDRMTPENTSISNGTDDGQSDEVPLAYLAASTKPGSMGRQAHYEIQEIVWAGEPLAQY